MFDHSCAPDSNLELLKGLVLNARIKELPHALALLVVAILSLFIQPDDIQVESFKRRVLCQACEDSYI